MSIYSDTTTIVIHEDAQSSTEGILEFNLDAQMARYTFLNNDIAIGNEAVSEQCVILYNVKTELIRIHGSDNATGYKKAVSGLRKKYNVSSSTIRKYSLIGRYLSEQNDPDISKLSLGQIKKKMWPQPQQRSKEPKNENVTESMTKGDTPRITSDAEIEKLRAEITELKKFNRQAAAAIRHFYNHIKDNDGDPAAYAKKAGFSWPGAKEGE